MVIYLFIVFILRRILTMKKQQRKNKQHLNYTAIFIVFAAIGFALLVLVINLLGLDYWNWPVIPASAGMAAVETAENLEMGAMTSIFFLGVLFTVGMPIVATAAIDLYFGPK